MKKEEVNMKKLIYLSIGIMFSLLTGEQSLGSQYRTINYDDAREEGGFNAPTLTNVMELATGGRTLNEIEITDLTSSKTLTNLRTLDLRNQPLVNDDVIRQLAANPTFARIITLKLGGTNITDESIARIASSPSLGSIRDLPQISGTYDIPSSVVRVYAKDTRVTDKQQKTKFEFHIEYRPPNPGAYPWEPDDHGVKIVEIESW